MSGKMVVFEVNDGEDSAVVSWTEEYGFIAAGSMRLLGMLAYEVRYAEVPVAPAFVPASGAAYAPPGAKVKSAGEGVVEYLVPDEPDDTVDLTSGPCFVCGCRFADHPEGGGCAQHDCRAYVP